MDTSGNNRYELLFMDDDGSAPAGANTAVTNKPPTPAPGAAVAVAPKKPQASKKPIVGSEKENKAAVMNKNESGKMAAAGKAPANRSKPGAPGAGATNRSRPNGSVATEGGHTAGYRPQNNDNREQRPYRRNFREGGFNNAGGNDYNNDQQRPPRQFRDRENRGPPRNRNGENGVRFGKREFDRQSGSDKTGVKSIDKRDGAGAHNWGSVKQDIDDVNKPNTETEGVLTDKEESANDQSTEQVPIPEEEETKEFTLDEWKAMRQTRNKPQYNIRKAGEGEDTTQWNQMVVLSKKKDGDSEEELEYDPSLYPQRVGRLQRIVDIQFNFKDGRRGGGAGGFGRGRGRGGIRPGGDRGRFEGSERPRFDGGERNRFEGGERGRFEGGEKPRFEGGERGRFEGGERGRFEGGERGRFEGGERGRFEGGRGGDRPRFEGGRGGAQSDAARSNVGRTYADRQRGGQSALKVDDERQFPTLS